MCIRDRAKKGSPQKAYVKEAINIDMADEITGGVGCTWAKQDKTPCVNIKVTNSCLLYTSRCV